MQGTTDSAAACADATLQYAKRKAGGPDTLTYRDGVRDALCGYYGPRARGVTPEGLPYDYLAGRDTAVAVKSGAIEPDSTPGAGDYWQGFLDALRGDHYNDIDPSNWYCAGCRDGEIARERVEAGGVIGGYTESDPGHVYTSYRVVVLVSGRSRLPDRVLGPYAEWHEAEKDRDALRAVGRTAKVEGNRYVGLIGDDQPLRQWDEIESL